MPLQRSRHRRGWRVTGKVIWSRWCRCGAMLATRGPSRGDRSANLSKASRSPWVAHISASFVATSARLPDRSRASTQDLEGLQRFATVGNVDRRLPPPDQLSPESVYHAGTTTGHAVTQQNAGTSLVLTRPWTGGADTVSVASY